MNSNEYFKPKSYFGFLIRKITSGQAYKTAVAILDKIRKYTFFSTVFKVVAFIVALLEKSAVLLLAVSVMIFTLPVLIFIGIIYVTVCKIAQIKWNKKIGKWIVSGATVTVFITKERILSNIDKKLFFREAKSIAKSKGTPVIIVCKDTFLCAKWLCPSLLAVNSGYFFVLKRKFIEKNHLASTCIVL